VHISKCRSTGGKERQRPGSGKEGLFIHGKGGDTRRKCLQGKKEEEEAQGLHWAEGRLHPKGECPDRGHKRGKFLKNLGEEEKVSYLPGGHQG